MRISELIENIDPLSIQLENTIGELFRTVAETIYSNQSTMIKLREQELIL